MAALCAFGAVASQASAASGKDHCYAFPEPKLRRQILNVEFRVVGFDWYVSASADDSGGPGGSSATVKGEGGQLVGYQHGGYDESQSTPINAGGYTHLPAACQFHNGSGSDNGSFVVHAHVPFSLTGTWSVPPDSGTCNDSDSVFDPYIGGGFSQYGSTVKIQVKYQAFPLPGNGVTSQPDTSFPGDDTRCDPPDPILDYPGLDTRTFSLPDETLLNKKKFSLLINTGFLPLVPSEGVSRTGKAGVLGRIDFQRVGPLRCASHTKCGAAPFQP